MTRRQMGRAIGAAAAVPMTLLAVLVAGGTEAAVPPAASQQESVVRDPGNPKSSSIMNRVAEKLKDKAPSPENIEAALVSEGATDVTIQPWTGEDPAPTTRRRALPSDLFSVWTTRAEWFEGADKHVALYGLWDYKTGFIGSGAPHNGAGMQLDGFSQTCWRNVSTGVSTQRTDGVQTSNYGYLKTSGHQSGVFGVQDDTSAFQLMTDKGFVWIDMRRIKQTCRTTKSGRFYHEHNQGGSPSGWIASVSLFAFNISYSGSAGETLQKAAPITYL